MKPLEQCPDEKFLDQFVNGSLLAPAAAALERHAAACPACRAMLDALERSSVATPANMARKLGATQGATEPAELLPPGSAVGRYIVLEQLGAGGMGVVYAASDPELGRKVALKLMRADRASGEGGAFDDRLVREAQSMARLAHPNVVTVHDVGWIGDQVFIAMELVDGRTLTGWLAESPRSWREVVAAFVAAGRGLAAAHEAGVLHRDFKPDNVLVGRDGRVRVMDFGLARSVSSRLAPPDEAIGEGPRDWLALSLTRTGDVMGTPFYMAPEQLAGAPTDPRSDQFSFCVALWEALHRQRPFEGDSIESLRSSVGEGKLREPPRGARIPRRLRRIVARGLAPRPDDRYPSMGALLDELVSASGRKAMWMVAAATALGLAAAGAVFLPRGEPPPALCTGAEQSFGQVWDAVRRARVERAFAAAHVPYATDAWKSVARILDGYRDRWVAMHTDACKATRVYGEQTENVLGLRMVCLEGRRREFGALVDLLSAADAKLVERSVAAASALQDVATCADVAGLTAVVPPPADPATRQKVNDLRTRLADARALQDAGRYGPALDQARPIGSEAAALAYRPVEAEAFLALGHLQRLKGERDAAEDSLLRAVRAAEAGRHDRAAAEAWIELVHVVGYEKAQHARGLEFAQHAAAVLERLGGDEAIEASLERALGTIESEQGRPDQATEHFGRAVALLERKLGADDPGLAGALDDLGIATALSGHLDRAIELHGRALALRERALGPDHPLVAQSIMNLGNAHQGLGKLAEAEREFRRALALRERALGPDHAEVAVTLANLGSAVDDQGRQAEALEIEERGIAVAEKAFGPEHPSLVIQLLNNGLLLRKLGRDDDAMARYRRAQTIAVKAFGPEHVHVAYSWIAMGDLSLNRDRPRVALAQFQRALPILEKTYGPTHPQVAQALLCIGKSLLDLRKPARALPVLERLDRFPTDSYKPDDIGLRRFYLARALWETKRDRPRARRLALGAREVLARAEAGTEGYLADVDRWLARHRERPARSR